MRGDWLEGCDPIFVGGRNGVWLRSNSWMYVFMAFVVALGSAPAYRKDVVVSSLW